MRLITFPKELFFYQKLISLKPDGLIVSVFFLYFIHLHEYSLLYLQARALLSRFTGISSSHYSSRGDGNHIWAIITLNYKLGPTTKGDRLDSTFEIISSLRRVHVASVFRNTKTILATSTCTITFNIRHCLQGLYWKFLTTWA